MRALLSHEVHSLTSGPSPQSTITVVGTPPGSGSPPGVSGGRSGGPRGGGESHYENFTVTGDSQQYDLFKFDGNPTNIYGDQSGKSDGSNVFDGIAGNYLLQDAVNKYGGSAIADNINAMAASGNYAGAASYGTDETIQVSAQYTGTGNPTVGFEKLAGILGTTAGGIVGGAAAFSKGDFVDGFKGVGSGIGVLSADAVVTTTDTDVQAALRDVANSLKTIFTDYNDAQYYTINLGSPGGSGVHPVTTRMASARDNYVASHLPLMSVVSHHMG